MKRLFDLLDSVAERPAMYLGTVTCANARTFLIGLHCGCELAGIDWLAEDYSAVLAERGWDTRGPLGIESAFIQAGLSQLQMVRELIAIEKAAYFRALASSGKQEQKG